MKTLKPWPISQKAWEEKWSEFKALHGCVQDKRYHAEGDVAIHTEMVRAEALILANQNNLTARDRWLLEGAAKFHDIAKPLCTEITPEGITAKGHSRRGAQLTRNLLYKDGINFIDREEIVNLVRKHAVPLHFLEAPDQKIIETSQVCQLNLLGYLAEADVRGRICQDQESLITNCLLFRDQANDKGCSSTAWNFQSDYARYDYFRRRDGNFIYTPYDDTQFEVIILAGLPGSGKDSWINQNWDGPVVCMDAIRKTLKVKPEDNQGEVIQAALESARGYLRKKEAFVWNSTNLLHERRLKIIELCADYHARTQLVYLEVPYQELLKRNKERSNDKQLPTAVLERMLGMLEVPSNFEASKVSYITEPEPRIELHL